MSVTIDSLDIKITSEIQSSIDSISKLQSALKKLNNATAGLNVSLTVNKLRSFSQSISSVKVPEKLGTNLSKLANGVAKLNKQLGGNFQGLASLGQALQPISNIGGGQSLSKVVSALGRLPAAMNNLNNADVGMFTQNVRQLSPALGELGATAVNATNAVSTINRLQSGLGKLQTAASGFDSTQIGTTLQGLATQLNSLQITSNLGSNIKGLASGITSLQKLSASGFGSLTQLGTALVPLSNVQGGESLSRLVSSLRRLPDVITKLNASNVSAFVTNVKQLAPALTQLGNAATMANTSLQGMGQNIRSLTSSVRQSGGGNGQGLGGIFRVGVSLAMLRRVASAFASVIDLSNKYQEDLNLFTAALGEYAAEAKTYAETVSEAMGIDPAEWLRGQGVFQTLITGFGVANDRAITMSKNLTQLAYDLSSYFNIDVAEAMTKLKSGISGELEPLRQLGYDLSEARLKAIALSMGIEQTYSKMSQAEKSQLRYQAILTQVTVAQGDMARTLDAPANQLRILQAQVTQAGRAIGNIFIPMLNAILPIASAVVKAVREIANAIASLFGFSLTEVDYSGLESATESTDELGSSLSSAGGAANDLKNALMGFDEINKLTEKSSGGGGGNTGYNASDWAWDLSEYDFLGDAVNERLDKVYNKIKPIVDWVKENIESILVGVASIGSILLGWSISHSLLGNATSLASTLSGIWSLFAAGGVMYISLDLMMKFEKEYLDTENLTSFAKQVLSSAAGVVLGGSLLANSLNKFGMGAGKAIKLGMAVPLAIDGVATLVVSADDAMENGWTWSNTLESLKGTAETSLATYLGLSAMGVSGTTLNAITLAVGGLLNIAALAPAIVQTGINAESLASVAMSAFMVGAAGFLVAGTAGLGVGLGIVAAITLTSIGMNLINRGIPADTDNKTGPWGDVHASAETIQTMAQTIFDNVNVDAHVNVLSASIAKEDEAKSMVDTALTGFVNLWTTYEETNPIKIGVKLNKTAGELASDITDNILPGIEDLIKDKNTTLKAFVSMGGFKDEKGNDVDLTGVFTSFETDMYDVGARLGEKLNEGMSKEMTAGMLENINALRDIMNIYAEAETGANLRGEAKLEALGYLQMAKDTYDIDTNLETYRQYKEKRDSQEKSFGETYDKEIVGRLYTEQLQYKQVLQNLTESRNNTVEGSEGWNTYTAEIEKVNSKLKEVTDKLGTLNKEGTVGDWMTEVFGDTDKWWQQYISEALSYRMNNGTVSGSLSDYYTEYTLGVPMEAVVEKAVPAVQKALNTILDDETLIAAFDGSIPESLAKQFESRLGELWPDVLKSLGWTITPEESTAAENLSNTVSELTAAESALQNQMSDTTSKLADAANTLSGVNLPEKVKITVNSNITLLGNVWSDVLSDSYASEVDYGGAYGNRFAKGGYPASGSVFIAGEAGPELVGKIGNKTAVANEGQIADALSDQMGGGSGIDENTLANAIVGAMKSAGMGAVYLDGKQLAQSINNETRRIGRSAILI